MTSDQKIETLFTDHRSLAIDHFLVDTDQQLLEGGLRTEMIRQELATQEVAEEEQAQRFDESAQIEEEISYANQLAAQQEADSTLKLARDLYDRGMAFGSPSMLKWGIIFCLAIVNDVIDLLALTGFLEILSWLISLGLTAIILLIIWFTDGGMKGAQEYMKKAQGTALEAQFRVQAEQIESRMQNLAKGTADKLKKIPGFEKIGVRDTPRKNPLARALMGSTVESVPFLGAVNLITVWVFFSYLAERHAYRTAREAAEDAYQQTSATAIEMV